MKTPLSIIQEGIASGNMELIKQGYEQLEKAKKSKPKKTAAKKKPKQANDDEELSLDSVYIPSKNKTPAIPGPVKGRKPNLFTVVENPKELAKNKKKAKRKEKRDPYKEVIIPCDKCGQKFDLRKEYPCGFLSEKSSKLCNKCQGK